MSNEVYYNIEKILDRRKVNGGKYEYKIKWEGYPMSESTWEPMKNLMTAKELVDEYDRSHPIGTTQKKNGSENKKREKDTNMLSKKRKDDTSEKEEKEEKEINGGQDKVNPPEDNNNQEGAGSNKEYDTKPNSNENTYIIDDSLKSVVTVKQQSQKLMAVVEKLETDGAMNRVYIPTEELRKTNPWILLNFYESKIKFT